ncbi:type IV secretory system conjugative DNA transfer family protein [Spongiactinospora sp. 9N601]|uniref:type IV secretory system conjugative DNA transfer family protein n=1 Tax=Spongiactinospora sp. 9N601 TaxID=3375149 RepID=UPI0037B3E5CF
MIHADPADLWKLAAALATAETVMAVLHLTVHRLRHRRWSRDARCVEILAPPTADMAGAEALWTNLMGLLRSWWKRLLLGQHHLAFEYVFSSDGMRIRMWVPGVVPKHLVEHAIEAAWPSARTRIEAADQPIRERGWSTGGQFVLARGERLPIRHDHASDPLRALTGAVVGMPPGQRAVVQILARPAAGRRLSGVPKRTVSALLDLITPGPQQVTSLEGAGWARAVRDKAQRPQYEVAIRYAVQVDRPAKAAARGRAHAIASAFALYSGHNRFQRQRMYQPVRRLAARRMTRGFLLSVPELAALAHLPLDTAVPGLRRARANSVPPSPAIPYGGPRAKILGTSDSGHERTVALGVVESCHHVHVLGPNGTGKSTLLAQMILSDIQAGRGTVVIEAKGDLVRDLLGLLPKAAGEKVVLIDPDDRHRRPALNMLGGPDPVMGVDNLVGIFREIYADHWGPRTDDILRGCALTLAGKGGTLADIPKLLSDPTFRQRLIATINDPVLRGFWTWYASLSEQSQAHVTAPIMNKLRAFLLRSFVRDVVGSAESTFDLGDVLDGGILLVRLPKGVLGDDTARLLGSMLLAQVWQTAARRARLGHARRPAALYVDECVRHEALQDRVGVKDPDLRPVAAGC